MNIVYCDNNGVIAAYDSSTSLNDPKDYATFVIADHNHNRGISDSSITLNQESKRMMGSNKQKRLDYLKSHIDQSSVDSLTSTGVTWVNGVPLFTSFVNFVNHHQESLEGGTMKIVIRTFGRDGEAVASALSHLIHCDAPSTSVALILYRNGELIHHIEKPFGQSSGSDQPFVALNESDVIDFIKRSGPISLIKDDHTLWGGKELKIYGKPMFLFPQMKQWQTYFFDDNLSVSSEETNIVNPRSYDVTQALWEPRSVASVASNLLAVDRYQSLIHPDYFIQKFDHLIKNHQ